MRALHLYDRVDILRSSTAQGGCWSIRPLEEFGGHLLCHLRCIILPGVCSTVDHPLVLFSFVAREIREDAWEGYLHERTCCVRPLELAEQIDGDIGIPFAFVNARIRIDFCRHERVVVADVCIPLVEAF